MSDSTRSYNEIIGRDIVARSDTYEGTVGRTQFSMRNTRVGFVLDSPGSASSARRRSSRATGRATSPAPRTRSAGIVTGQTLGESPYHNSPTFRSAMRT